VIALSSSNKDANGTGVVKDGRLATGVNKPLTQAQIHLSPQDLASASGAEPGTCSKRPIT
jgi:hypothetical protein